MKKLKIHYLSIAEKDITEIIDYISKDNPNAALNLIEKIDTKIKVLSNNWTSTKLKHPKVRIRPLELPETDDLRTLMDDVIFNFGIWIEWEVA